MEITRLIVDVVARIGVPIFVTLIGRKVVEDVTTRKRIDNVEKQIREHIQGCSDEESSFMDKTLKEVFSKPSMRWFR
jgi:hypothetical protein